MYVVVSNFIVRHDVDVQWAVDSFQSIVDLSCVERINYTPLPFQAVKLFLPCHAI